MPASWTARTGRPTLTMYLGPLRGPVGGKAPHSPSGCPTLGCLPPWSPWVTTYPRARARGMRRRPLAPVDKPPETWGQPVQRAGHSERLPPVTVPSPTLTGMPGQVAPDPARHELRPCEAQRILGVGRTTLHEYEASGLLVARRTIGGHRRYPVDQPAIQAALGAL